MEKKNRIEKLAERKDLLAEKYEGLAKRAGSKPGRKRFGIKARRYRAAATRIRATKG